MPFGKLQVGSHMPFTLEWLLTGHSTIKPLLLECCRDGCPSGRFSHLHRGTLELGQSDHQVFGHLPDQAPSPHRLRSLAGRPALGKVLVVPNFFHLRMMEATPRHNHVSAHYGQFLQPHGLVFADMLCQPYIDRCVPFNIQSIEFTTGGLQSSRNI